ncbi:anti-sigma factor [Paraburkholderia sp.]|uniref:anti-sigma factor n=1 Tax=Paraburkholderia sp. TaxID=1926495 RepID=UPI003D6F5AB1
MNTSLSGPGDLRCAEYVLGVLDTAGRREIEKALQRDPRLADSTARWQNRLLPLGEDIGEMAPPAYVWTRIESELGFVSAAPRRPPTGFWNNLRAWRWVGIGSSMAVAALVVLSVVPLLHKPAAVPGAGGYMVASIVGQDSGTGWTATVDVQRARMVIVPVTATPIAVGHSAELWLIPPGARPIPLGLVAADHPTIVSLSGPGLAQLATRTVLAVSLEPPGGSPTGLPTGPVVAKGVVDGA